jgi:hypothetical protein
MIYTYIEGVDGQLTYTKGIDIDDETLEGNKFEDFIDGYPAEFKILSNKAYGDLFIGCEFDEYGKENPQGFITRSIDNIKGIHFLVLDYDDGTSIIQTENNIKDYSYLLHTSYNHQHLKNDIKCDRFRVIIPLQNEVTVSDFIARRDALINMFPTVDKASFSCSQGFLTPSKKSSDSITYFNSNIGKKFDLLSLEATEHSDLLDSLPSVPSSKLADYREANYLSRAANIVSGERFKGLQSLSSWLRYYHAEYSEIESALDNVVRSFPDESRLKHQNKVQGIAKWASRLNRCFAPTPIQLFSPSFVSIEEAQKEINEALIKEEDLSIIVTAGVGKTRLAIDFAIDQALKGKEVAFYAASNSFQDELRKEIQKRRADESREAPTNAFRKPTYKSAPVIISARNKTNCDFYESTIVELKRRETEGETGLVGSYCKSDCLYSANNGEGCGYAEQFKTLNRVKIYTHAHLFSQSSLFDKHYKPDIVIIDEDPFSSCHAREEFNVEKANRIKSFYKSSTLKKRKFEGAVGTLLIELSYTNLTSPNELLIWCNDYDELIEKAHKEQLALKKIHKEDRTNAPKFFEHRIVNALREILTTQAGTNNIFVKNNVVYYTFLKKPLIPKSARIIALDATGDTRIISTVLKRRLNPVKIDVNKSDSATIVQVSNTGASQSRIKNNDGYAKSRKLFLEKRKKKGAKIITKRIEEMGPLYYGKCRGSNLFNDCKELHIAMNYNLPPNSIEMATRAVFWDSSEPFDYDGNNLVSGNTVFEVFDNVVNNFVYLDHRARAMDSYLARAEIEQAVHRARPVRRTSENPVNIFIHTNRVLNITLDKRVKWQSLYGYIDGDMQRSNDAFEQFKRQVFEGAKEGLVWKSRNIKALGISQSQWNRYNDIIKLKDQRFYAIKVTYRNKFRKQKTECAIYSCELYRDTYIEPALNSGALEALLDAKAIMSTKIIFGNASLNIESS